MWIAPEFFAPAMERDAVSGEMVMPKWRVFVFLSA
jgi:hypothetical protein